MHETNISKFNKILEELSTKQNVCIPIHIAPDGDSVGSACALYILTKNLNINSGVYCSDKLPRYIKDNIDTEFIHEGVDFEHMDLNKFDCVLAPDISSEDLLSTKSDFELPRDIKKLVIDHHGNNTLWGEINIIDSEAAATCTLVYKLLKECDLLTPEMAPYLSLGILTDTGYFKNMNTKPEDFSIIGDLFSMGFNVSKLMSDLAKETLEQKYFKNIIYKNLTTNEDYRYAYSYCTDNDKEEIGLDRDKKYGNGIFELTNLKGYKFAFFVAEKSDYEKPTFSVAFRAIEEGIDVSLYADKLDVGGGHPRAAGGIIKDCDNIEDALNKIKDIIVSIENR